MSTLQDPETGLRVTVVEPGSPEDPFTKGGASVPVEQVVDPSAQAQVTMTGDVPTAPANQAPAQTQAPQAAPQAQPGTQAPDQATAGTEPTTEDEWSQEEQEALAKLQTFLSGSTEEALRRQQSSYDRTISVLKGQLDERANQQTELAKQVRELQLNGLPQDEAAKLRTKFEEDDKKAELDAYAQELEGWHRELLTTAFVQAYGAYGVGEEQLSSCETPEAMEALCLEAKADYFERKANGEPLPAPTTATPNGKPAGITAADVRNASTDPNASQVPAGAQKPTDVGGGGPAPEGSKWRTDASPDALADNLRNLPVASVRIR